MDLFSFNFVLCAHDYLGVDIQLVPIDDAMQVSVR
jgi:hypothetical protein